MSKYFSKKHNEISPRLKIISWIISLSLVLGACIGYMLSDKSNTQQILKERDAVTQCYQNLRAVPSTASDEKLAANVACNRMKDENMKKWNRYKF
jgi:hypothetical protein